MGEGELRIQRFAQLFSDSNKLVWTDLFQGPWFTLVQCLRKSHVPEARQCSTGATEQDLIPGDVWGQCSRELLSWAEDSGPRNMWRFKPQNSRIPFQNLQEVWKLVSCLARFLWAERRRKASELWECVCVLVSLLVGLGILSKLVRLVRSGLSGCSLVCLLVFRLVLF